jgi:NADH-quinone oxidoreductase subunit N
MDSKLTLLWPEISLFITTCCVMILGQSKHKDSRNLAPWLCAIGLCISGFLAWQFRAVTVHTSLPHLPFYGKMIVALVGLVMLPMMAGTADRDLEHGVDHGKPFDALRSTRGEFYSFFLFSLSGLMLCASADDLIFLFLALELTSLPTYVMVALSTARNRSMEAGVKYFFLGALGAAIFLYGFALIYGASGSTNFHEISRILSAQVASSGGLNHMALLGLVLAILGVCFKIAAVPMHFYTPDVYQGASASVAGFLAFVPKAAGFFAILLLCSLVGWGFGDNHQHLPAALRTMLWVIAAATMTVGNVLAIMQNSVKRMLAYSSIAHSGYMLVGVLAGPGGSDAPFTRNGIAAVLFYLASYAIMTLGAFSVLASLQRKKADGSVEEADDIDDLRGLALTRPLLGWTMVLSSMGLLGLPPLLGFLGKVPLFTAAIGANEIPLVIVLGLNSAIAAYYYLRLAYTCFIEQPENLPSAPKIETSEFYPSRRITGVLSMVGVVGLALAAGFLADLAQRGGTYEPTRAMHTGAAVPAIEAEHAAPIPGEHSEPTPHG